MDCGVHFRIHRSWNVRLLHVYCIIFTFPHGVKIWGFCVFICDCGSLSLRIHASIILSTLWGLLGFCLESTARKKIYWTFGSLLFWNSITPFNAVGLRNSTSLFTICRSASDLCQKALPWLSGLFYADCVRRLISRISPLSMITLPDTQLKSTNTTLSFCELMYICLEP